MDNYDIVYTSLNSIMFYSLKRLDKLDYYIDCIVGFSYQLNGEEQIKYLIFKNDSKDVYLKGDYENIKMEQTYTDNQTKFENNVNRLTIIIELNLCEIKINNEIFEIKRMDFYVEKITVTEKSKDLNKCIYNKLKGDNYPTNVTIMYPSNSINLYGDLNILENNFFFNIELNDIINKRIKIFSKAENDSVLIINFLPTNDIGKCYLSIRTYFDNQFKEYPISIMFYYRLSDLIKWKDYYNNDKFYVSLTNNVNNSESNVAFWLFNDNFIINRRFQFSMATYRYVYSCLKTHDIIGKSNFHVSKPPYDHFYPICLSIQDYETYKCSDLPSDLDITKYKDEVLDLIKENVWSIDNPMYISDIIKEDMVLHFSIKIKSINDGLEESNYYYIQAIVYKENGLMVIKNLFNGKNYLFNDFLNCFNFDFNEKVIKEKITFDIHLLIDFFPCNCMYGSKEINIIGFYTKRYFNFYSNRQINWNDDIYNDIINEIKKSAFEISYFSDNYIRRIYLIKENINKIYFIMKAITLDNNDFIISDLYDVNNGKIIKFTLNYNIDDISCEVNDIDFNIYEYLSLDILVKNQTYYSVYNGSTYSYTDLCLTYNKNAKELMYMKCFISQIEMENVPYSLEIIMWLEDMLIKNGYKTDYNPNKKIKFVSTIVTCNKNGNKVILSDLYEIGENNSFKSIEIGNFYELLNGHLDKNRIVKCKFEGELSRFNYYIETNEFYITFNYSDYIVFNKNGKNSYNYIDLYYNYGTENSEDVKIMFKY